MMLFLSLLVLISFHAIFGTELCKDKEWYNDLAGKCHPCKPCGGKLWEMAPCSEFTDTLCVDLSEIARSVMNTPKDSRDSNHVLHHKWHEMEGEDATADILTKETMLKRSFDNIESIWSQVILMVLAIAFIFIVVAVILMILKYCGKIGSNSENRKTVARARLFSRDRLNTTEYMNNLATLDRRLAIDEILEKRKRAIFEPQLLNENLYTDEVFVDISGLPRGLRDSHNYEELDHRKCLLQMDQQ